jgi:peptidoglycan/LPS O-acetylase OafA/YrhL
MGGPEIKALTGLRGYAALGVCVFHYTMPWTAYDNWAMPLARHGFYGVAIFFVLSGFILFHVYRTWFDRTVTAARYGRFMWHRFARIYPLHILLLVVAAGLTVEGPWGAMRGNQFDTPLTFVLNVLLVHAWGYHAISWNGPSWTISVEFFAYLLFPFLAVMVRRGHILALCGIGALAVFALEFSRGVSRDEFGFNVLHYFPMFVIGMLACEISHRYGSKIRSSWPFDAVVVVATGWLIWKAGYQGWYVAVPYASAVLIFGLYREGPLGHWLFGNPVAVFLGNISYALYLSHGIVYAVISAAILGGLGWIGAGVRMLGFDRPLIEFPLVATVGAAIVVSAVLYYSFERPARWALRALLPAQKDAKDAMQAQGQDQVLARASRA